MKHLNSWGTYRVTESENKGRIKSIAVKTLAEELIRSKGGKFTADFGKNKAALGGIRPIKSKKVRNVLAGYITKKMKRVKETGL